MQLSVSIYETNVVLFQDTDTIQQLIVTTTIVSKYRRYKDKLPHLLELLPQHHNKNTIETKLISI